MACRKSGKASGSMPMLLRSINPIRTAARPFATSPTPLGQTKVSDVKGTLRSLKPAGRSLFQRYAQRYLLAESGQGAVLFHIILAVGTVGYCFEYPHLSMRHAHCLTL